MSEDVKAAHRRVGTLHVRQDSAIVYEEKAAEQKRQVKRLAFCGLFLVLNCQLCTCETRLRDQLNHNVARSR